MSSTAPESPNTPIQIPWVLDPMSEPGCRPDPREPLATSWRTNHLRITTDSGVFTVRPAQQGETSATPDALFPGTSRVHILTAWNPAGLPKTLQDNISADAELWSWEQDDDPSPAVVYGTEHAWVEPSLALKDHTRSDALRDAHRFTQPVVLEWDSAGMRPLATGVVDVSGLDETPYPVVVEPAPLGCPMTVGFVGPCRSAGGPYGSRAINAAAMWQQHRALLVSAFGCADQCPRSHGGAIALENAYVPSRFGGWQWADRRADAQREEAMGHLGWIGDGLVLAFLDWDPEYINSAYSGEHDGRQFTIVPSRQSGRWGLILTHSEEGRLLGSRFVSNEELRRLGMEQQRDHVWATLGELIGSPPRDW
ncbi:DUF3293 domain-containing protein [Rudaeicoccus suwonensis]|uniref:Uncharacterized protein DUF3293 n=1 Tax=Rudaeicoccus suwonensis TaxID=657409 RepID=A0A561E3R3_9MICO|nr:DUF3293 domain-containing protein [Rudaeicoccus suwonensis]TWE10253.1 uncharacterized protein DUF3293 [Rudaeicoccus suwonensis]